MAGTNAVSAKQALITWLRGLTDTGEGLEGVQVAYSWPGLGRVGRECVHGGRAEWETELNSMRAAGLRQSRIETVTLDLHIVVSAVGGTVEDADVRAVAIGTVIEEALAADPLLGGHPGLQLAMVAGGDIEHEDHDDGAVSVLTYRVLFRSRLT